MRPPRCRSVGPGTRFHRVGVVLALVLLPITLQAQSTTASTADKAQQFVSAFYAWYVPLALQPQGGATWERALTKKASWFGDEIGRRLREDAKAQAMVKDEIVGLDADPFLASQDPCERYEVGKATKSGESYRARVYAVCGGVRQAMPQVIAEVTSTKGQWVFVNFHYPDGHSDLLHELATLRRERRKE